ncbi:MAG: hypothetical protein M3N59_02575 [bacterium]|nr:hypothetical protein [bacterium]
MVDRNQSRTLAGFLALGILVVPSTAHAYIDPGTGSVIIQAIIGGVVAVGFFLKTNWLRVKQLLRRVSGGKKK